MWQPYSGFGAVGLARRPRYYEYTLLLLRINPLPMLDEWPDTRLVLVAWN